MYIMEQQKDIYLIWWRVSGIPFIKYAENQKNGTCGKPNKIPNGQNKKGRYWIKVRSYWKVK